MKIIIIVIMISNYLAMDIFLKINNLGTMWPRSAVLWLVDKMSSTQCLKVSRTIENTRYREQQKISRTKEKNNSKAKRNYLELTTLENRGC